MKAHNAISIIQHCCLLIHNHIRECNFEDNGLLDVMEFADITINDGMTDEIAVSYFVDINTCLSVDYGLSGYSKVYVNNN